MVRHPWIRSDTYPNLWTAVYRLYDAADRLLYVGIGYDFRARWKAHAKKDWWPQVARKDVIWYDNRLTAAWEEAKAILFESPVYNDRPGLGLMSLLVFRVRDGYRGWIDVPEPEMLTHKYLQDAALRKARDNQAQVAVAMEDDVVGVIVSWDWYRKVCVALGDLSVDAVEAQIAEEWQAAGC